GLYGPGRSLVRDRFVGQCADDGEGAGVMRRVQACRPGRKTDREDRPSSTSTHLAPVNVERSADVPRMRSHSRTVPSNQEKFRSALSCASWVKVAQQSERRKAS